MSAARRKLLTRLALLLLAGWLIGALYDAALPGLLLAALLALGLQLRRLFRFENALMRRRFTDPDFGDGIWSQMLARYYYLQQRGKRHKRRHRQLIKEVRDSANALPDGAVVLNSDFEILMSNEAAAELAGISPPQDRGHCVDNILRAPAFVGYLRSGDHQGAIEIPSPVRTGDWLSCRLVPYGEEQYLLLIRDITEHIRLTAMRRDFIANASHELRSPLTVISGYVDGLAADDDLPDHWRKPVAEMGAQVSRMNRIIVELLQLSRLESTGEAAEQEAMDVAALLEAARRNYAGREGAAAIDVEAPFQARLRGSVPEIESVIDNLLSNAVRHTPANGRITLSWIGRGDRGAELAVTDTGEGIEEEFIPRLTERFFRADPGRGRANGGVGLGLAIVKHVLGRHDAELRIDSTPGRGSRFACRFPAARLEAAEPVPLERDRQSG